MLGWNRTDGGQEVAFVKDGSSGASEAFHFYNATSNTATTSLGGASASGAWAWGPASGGVVGHTAQSGASDSHTLRIRNYTNSLRADGLTVSLANSNAAAGTLGSTAFLRGFNDASGETRNSTERVVIRTDGNVYNVNNVYGATSDVALKENITDARGYLNDLNLLRVVKYNLKDTPDLPQLGLIAQEAEIVFPGLVEGEDGSKSVKYSVINMMMLKALQELSAQNAALMARIEALESAATQIA